MLPQHEAPARRRYREPADQRRLARAGIAEDDRAAVPCEEVADRDWVYGHEDVADVEARRLALLQPKADIAEHAHVGPERVAAEGIPERLITALREGRRILL